MQWKQATDLESCHTILRISRVVVSLQAQRVIEDNEDKNTAFEYEITSVTLSEVTVRRRVVMDGVRR